MRLHCFGNSHVWSILGPGPNDARIERTDGDLELVGWKLGNSGATAFALPMHNTSSGAGDHIVSILDAEPGQKDVLMVFGEVDISTHIGHHGVPDGEDLDRTVARYAAFCKTILDRPDTGLVLVASAVPHSHIFRAGEHRHLIALSEGWNERLLRYCDELGLTYVDWYRCLDGADGSPYDGEVEDLLARNPSDPDECHLSEHARPFLMASIRVALERLNS